MSKLVSRIQIELTRPLNGVADPANRYNVYGEWELSEGADAKLIKGEATISLPPDVAARARRIFLRFARSQEVPDPVDPATPEGGKGQLYQFAAKCAFCPKL